MSEEKDYLNFTVKCLTKGIKNTLKLLWNNSTDKTETS